MMELLRHKDELEVGVFSEEVKFENINNQITLIKPINNKNMININHIDTLTQLCIDKIIQNIDKFDTVGALPKITCHKIIDKLMNNRMLTYERLYRFRHCYLDKLYICDGYMDWMSLVIRFPLKQLKLDHCNAIRNDTFEKLRDSIVCEHLEELTIIDCSGLNHHGLNVLNQCHYLKSLELINMDVTNQLCQQLSLLINIQKLILSNCSRLSSHGLNSLSSLKQLTYLNLSNCHKLHGTNALNILKSVPYLDTLILRNCINLTNQSLISLKYLEKIVHLDLYGLKNINDDGLMNLKSLTFLKHLCLTNTNVCNIFLKRLQLEANDLNVLHLSNSNICEEVLIETLAKMTSLKEIKVRNAKITDQVLLSMYRVDKLTKVDISDCKDLHLTIDHINIFNFNELRSLKARNCSFDLDGLELIGQFKNIEFLDISYLLGTMAGDISYCLSGLVTLKYLDISGVELDNDDLKAISNIIGLETLRLKHCDTHHWNDGSQHLRKLTSLTALNLSNCNINDTLILSFLPWIITNLTFLHMKRCQNISDITLNILIDANQLERLNIEGIENITDQGIEYLSNINSLTFLDISHIRNLTNRGISSLHTLTELKELKLSGCTLLSDDILPTIMNFDRLNSLTLEASLISSHGIEELQTFSYQKCCKIRLTKTLVNCARRKKNRSGSNQKIMNLMVLEGSSPPSASRIYSPSSSPPILKL